MPTQQQRKEITTSSHHIPQRKFKKPLPPTLSRSWKITTATFISVVAAIGQQPTYKLVTGFLNKDVHVPGYRVYFAKERRRKKTKRKRLRKKSS